MRIQEGKDKVGLDYCKLYPKKDKKGFSKESDSRGRPGIMAKTFKG